MPVTANTLRPVRFLRRLSGNMEPPVYSFPVGVNSTVIRKGDGMVISVTTPTGYVVKATGAANLGAPGTGILLSALIGTGLVGFAFSADSGAPPFPSSTGVTAKTNLYSGSTLFTTPSDGTTITDPIPDTYFALVCLALPDVVFYGHEVGTGALDITAPTRLFATTTGGLLRRFDLCVTASSTEPLTLESIAAPANAIAFALDWAYPQAIPETRSSTSGADPWRVRTGASGTTNPAVEFTTVGTCFNPTV